MSTLNLTIIATATLLMLFSSGCSIYEKYGFGKVASSRLDKSIAIPLELPANAPSISQRYRPLTGPTKTEHKGFDILVPYRTPVIAAGDGEVVRVELSVLYGKQVMVNHGKTSSGFRIQTRYFHLTEQLVKQGQQVSRGELLGYSGATGMSGGYPHLHFEVHRLNEDALPLATKFLDPQLFWVGGEGKVTCFDRKREFESTPVRLTYPVPCRGLGWQ